MALRMSTTTVASNADADVSEFSMQTDCRFCICRRCFFNCFICPKTIILLSELNLRPISSSMRIDTLWEITAIPPALVQNIRMVRRFPEIIEFIVKTITVPMIYFGRVFFGLHAPNDAVEHPHGAKKSDYIISSVSVTRSFPEMFGVPSLLSHFMHKMMKWSLAPHYYSGRAIIGEALAQKERRW